VRRLHSTRGIPWITVDIASLSSRLPPLAPALTARKSSVTPRRVHGPVGRGSPVTGRGFAAGVSRDNRPHHGGADSGFCHLVHIHHASRAGGVGPGPADHRVRSTCADLSSRLHVWQAAESTEGFGGKADPLVGAGVCPSLMNNCNEPP